TWGRVRDGRGPMGSWAGAGRQRRLVECGSWKGPRSTRPAPALPGKGVPTQGPTVSGLLSRSSLASGTSLAGGGSGRGGLCVLHLEQGDVLIDPFLGQRVPEDQREERDQQDESRDQGAEGVDAVEHGLG